MKANKIVGLGLAMMLGFGVVGCGDTQVEEQEQTQQEEQYVEEEQQDEYEYRQEEEYVEEQPQEKEEIKDEDVSDYYIQNRQQTDLEYAKEEIEKEFRENGLNSEIQINEENNLIIISQYFSINEIAQAIENGSWGNLCNNLVILSSRYHNNYNVNVGFVIGATDNGKIYLSVLNGETIYNVENELNK